MQKIITLLTYTLIGTTYFYGQNVQTLTKDNFQVSCPCKLKVNEMFLNAAKQQGVTYPISAYVCAENEDNYDSGVIYNINITDISSDYRKISADKYAYFETNYFKSYKDNLTKAGYKYKDIFFNGVNAVEYSFDMQDMPAKAIIFIKNKKSYLLQTASRKENTIKYNNLKLSFKFTN